MLGRLETQREGGKAVSHQINPQYVHREQRSDQIAQNSNEKHENLTEIGRKHELDGLHQIVINPSSLSDSRDYGGEIIICKHYVSRFL